MSGHTSFPRVKSYAAEVGAAALMLALALGTASAGLTFFVIPGHGSPLWWPVTGVALVLLIRCPRRWWPGLIVAFALGNVLVSHFADSLSQTITYAIVNVIELAIAGLVLTHGRDRRHAPRLATPNVTARFVLAVVAAMAVGSGLIAMSSLIFPTDTMPYSILGDYVISHALGLLSVAPLLLPGQWFPRMARWHHVEFAAVLAALAAVATWVYLQPGVPGHSVLALLPVVWAALRFDPWRATVVALVTSALAAYGSAHGLGTLAVIPDSSARELAAQITVATIGLITLMLVLVTRHRADLAAQRSDSAETARIAIRDALVGIYSVRLDADHLGEISEVNAAMCRVFGYRPDELLGQHCGILGARMHRDKRAELDEVLSRFADGTWDTYRQETSLFTATDEPRWVEISMTAVRTERTPPFVLIHVHDLTDRAEKEQLLEQRALHDPLTNLPNRAMLFRTLEHPPSGSADPALGLLFLDLDHFKEVNDSYGHAAGDAVLTTVAARLHEVVRPGDTVARLGGDEFAIICHGIGMTSELAPVAERVRGVLAPPVPLPSGEEASIGVSIGAAVARVGMTADELVSEADAAMYVDKRRTARRGDAAEVRSPG